MTGEPLAGIHACVFDAYGTLFDVASAAQRCADELGDAAPGSLRCGVTSSCNIRGCVRCRAGTLIFGKSPVTLSISRWNR